MPRNSLVNGKPAPDTLRRPARRGGLPDPDGPHRRAHRQGLLPGTHQARRRLRRRARPGVRQRALGGAERVLAVDDRRRDRRPRRGRCDRRTRTATPPARAIYRATADHYQRNDQDLDGDDDRPAQRRAVLHPAVQDRRPQRGRSATTSATAARTPTSGPSSTQGFLELPRLGILPADDADDRRDSLGSSTR